MHYITKLPDRLKSWALAAGLRTASGAVRSFTVVWEFGAPGHGKGVWDGIGAWMKRTVRQDIVDHRPPSLPTIKTESETILSPAEVLQHCSLCIPCSLHSYQIPISQPNCSLALLVSQVAEHLKATFENDEYVQSHLQKTINQVIVMFMPTEKIERPKPDHDYDTMDGMKKTFLFQVVSDSVILQRKFACWCASCVQMSSHGEGAMDSSYRCTECETWKQAEAGNGEYLKWTETSIARRDAAGVANDRARALANSRSLRDQLIRKFEQSNEPVWVGVQNRGEDVQSGFQTQPNLLMAHVTIFLPLMVHPESPSICRTQISTGLARRCRNGRFTRWLAAMGGYDMMWMMWNLKCSGMNVTSVVARNSVSSSERWVCQTRHVYVSLLELDSQCPLTVLYSLSLSPSASASASSHPKPNSE